jgi:uncharacterized protein (TIGR00255 family)
MIKSMTGYGRAEKESNGQMLRVELRSLNSKFFDLNLRVPFSLREKEFELRTLVSEKIIRGKADVSITADTVSSFKNYTINAAAAKQYFREISQIADKLKIKKTNLLQLVMNIPDVVQPAQSSQDESALYETIKNLLLSALKQLDEFRKTEGRQLENDLHARVESILNLLAQTAPFEEQRILRVRQQLASQMQSVSGGNDSNRFEQELIYYLEKMDFSEEKTRLRSHCDYFFEMMKEESNGRKLAFISQEMGREINTLGAKANDAEIQKVVVQMKDELEKIKEQLMNVL